MERFIKDERTGISYELIGDYYYPCLTSPASPNVGRYGRMRWRYLKEHRQVFYSQLVLSDKLASHLEEIDQSASEMMERLIKEFDFTDADITCLNVSRARELGAYHLMTAQNPVYLFTLQRREGAA